MRVLNDVWDREELAQVPFAGIEVCPVGRCLQDTRGQVRDLRFLTFTTLARFDDQHAGEESVRQHPLAQGGVVVRGNGCAVDHQAWLFDCLALVLTGFAAHRKHTGGCRIHGQQRPEDAFVSGILGFVDRLEQTIDLVRLKQHAGSEVQRILQPLARCEMFTQRVRLIDRVQNSRVDATRPVFSGRRVSQTEQVQVRPIVRLIADLAATEKRLQGECSAKR